MHVEVSPGYEKESQVLWWHHDRGGGLRGVPLVLRESGDQAEGWACGSKGSSELNELQGPLLLLSVGWGGAKFLTSFWTLFLYIREHYTHSFASIRHNTIFFNEEHNWIS